jgi:Nucleoside-diphosphate-sugar pyrophosphorylase involved in lipopolysaccharide biosynthesis/translation initiation factor 2B, gamma/epsilon subunits (eIF-2Bgamma/eIF-2Bepsilon)
MAVKGILMAGGKGTRLRPITYAIPKPLVPIAGLSCMEYPIKAFAEAGIRDIIVTTGYKFESLISGVIQKKHPNLNIIFSVEREPAGTAGSIKVVQGFLNDTFVVASGDVLADFDINEILKSHMKSKAIATMVLTEVEDPTQFGIVETRENRVVRFLEKPLQSEIFSNIVNAGIYVFEPEIFNHIPGDQTYDFAKELFPKLLKEGIEINTYIGKGAWLDTGRPRELILANKLMADKYGVEISEPNFKGKMILKERPIGYDFVIEGSCYLGEGVNIGKGAKVVNSTIYDNVVIGNSTEISDSIIFENCNIKDNSKIGKSLLMKNTTIGKDCEIQESALSANLNIQDRSKIYNVSLSSESDNAD